MKHSSFQRILINGKLKRKYWAFVRKRKKVIWNELGISCKGFFYWFSALTWRFTSVRSQHLATIQINSEMGKQRNKHDSNQNPFYQYQNQIDFRANIARNIYTPSAEHRNSMYLSHFNWIQMFFQYYCGFAFVLATKSMLVAL